MIVVPRMPSTVYQDAIHVSNDNRIQLSRKQNLQDVITYRRGINSSNDERAKTMLDNEIARYNLRLRDINAEISRIESVILYVS